MVEAEGKFFDFGRPRSLENTFLNVKFASIRQCIYGWY